LAQSECTDWRRYCDLTATVAMSAAGTVHAEGDTCLLSDPSCTDADDPAAACAFATATAAASNVTALAMKVRPPATSPHWR
jgi:hypothetical protein